MSAQLAQALQANIAACERIVEQYGAVQCGVNFAALLESNQKALAAHEAAPQQEPAITVTIDDLDLVQDWAESRLPPGTHKLYAAPQQAQAPSSSDYVIELLTAAGHVTAEQVERARAIAAQHYPLQQAQAPSEIQRRFDNLLAAEHALSNSYVRIREIIGAMSPPVLEPAALYAYVEDCARKWLFGLRGGNGHDIAGP